LRVFEGLTYAKRTRFTDIKINVDSALVVQVVKTSNLKSLFGLTLVNNIRRLVDIEWKVHITCALIGNQTNVMMF
jgi:ribonuclease HI